MQRTLNRLDLKVKRYDTLVFENEKHLKRESNKEIELLG